MLSAKTVSGIVVDNIPKIKFFMTIFLLGQMAIGTNCVENWISYNCILLRNLHYEKVQTKFEVYLERLRN